MGTHGALTRPRSLADTPPHFVYRPGVTPSPPSPIPAEVQRELATGEQLLWVGRPPQGLDLRREDGIEAIGLLAWEFLQFAIAVGVGGPAVAVFNGLLTAAAGTRVFHRLWVVPRRRRRTWYGLTADRLLVVAGPRAELHSVRLVNVAQVELEEWKDGRGVIRVRGPRPRAAEVAALELAAGAREAYDLIRNACREAGRAVTPPAAVHSP
jgi:hypothetical protein